MTPDPERTSYVMISSGKSRYVDEVHIPNAALWSSAELLTELQKSEGGESCVGQSNTSIQETGATHVSSETSNNETCANKRPFSHKEPFLRPKGSGKLFLPILRTEELCQYRSPTCLQEWCVTSNWKISWVGQTSRKESQWSYDMEGHPKKCVERYCDDHNCKKEELEMVGELSKVCSQIV